MIREPDRRNQLCALAVLASIGCSASGGNGDVAAAGSGTTGGGGQVTAGSIGSAAGATQSTTTGGGSAGATGSSTGAGAPATTGGGPAALGSGGGNVVSAAGSGAGGSAGSGVGGTSTGSGGTAGSTSVGGAASVSDTVTRTASTFAFSHFPIETNDSGVWSGSESPGTQTTSTTFDTVILENGYLKVTILPSYGGRVLSIVHKPTGRELLYQNPVGTPYLMLQDIFYYDYLVILGGIFPSFPEPEHGKYWNQPYDFEVVSESPEAVTVRMSRQDDQDLVTGVPDRYIVGRTDILVQVEVTLRAGRSNLELHTKLTNTRNTAVPEFEYWTVTTLAPGSTPGETAIPLNTRILADMQQVHLLESSWAWFGNAEERVDGEVFKWNNLSHFENWVDQGTAFANPDYRANWSGLVNYDNDMGIVCVSNDGEIRGLKLWTFGNGSLNVDTSDSTEWLRPTIEMWHGVTPEFWMRDTMAANEVRQWGDSYFATLGLREVTAASENGALYLSGSETGADTLLGVTATLNVPDQTVHAVLRLDGNVVAEQDVVVAPAEPTTLNATVATEEASSRVLEAEFLQGDVSLLSGQVTLP